MRSTIAFAVSLFLVACAGAPDAAEDPTASTHSSLTGEQRIGNVEAPSSVSVAKEWLDRSYAQPEWRPADWVYNTLAARCSLRHACGQDPGVTADECIAAHAGDMASSDTCTEARFETCLSAMQNAGCPLEKAPAGCEACWRN